MIKYLLIFCIAIIHLQAQDIKSYEKTRLADNIRIRLHPDLVPMTSLDLNDKYAAYRQPLAAFTNESREVDLIVNTAATVWAPADIPLLKNFYRSSIEGMFTRVDFLEDTIMVLNEQVFAKLEFVSYFRAQNDPPTVKPIKKYNQIYYYIYKGSVLIFNFTCEEQYQQAWDSRFETMMSTIKIR